VINVGIVQGSKESAKEVIVGYDTVYVHSDIEDVSYTDEFGNYIEMYQYNEIQYKKDEYIELMADENIKLKISQSNQDEEILNNMIATTEIFEMVLGAIPDTYSVENRTLGGDKMVEIYCTLIIKGVKSIDDVPLMLKEKVIERLKQLEVDVK
jgi:hypothetical protein